MQLIKHWGRVLLSIEMHEGQEFSFLISAGCGEDSLRDQLLTLYQWRGAPDAVNRCAADVFAGEERERRMEGERRGSKGRRRGTWGERVPAVVRTADSSLLKVSGRETGADGEPSPDEPRAGT